MRALLVHDTASGADVAVALDAAGYDVVRCTEPGRPGFPCLALDGECPLDATVDVAVAVHDRPTADLAGGELGVVCALRDGLPLVAMGQHPQLAVGGRADAVATGADDVADACERARRASAARAATLVARIAGTDVTVERRGDVVEVTVVGPGATARHAVRAHQAARALYPTARTITVRHD